MLYEGLSKRHALRLIDIYASNRDDVNDRLGEYYLKNRQSIHNSLFKDAYFGYKFWSLLSDNIKRSHTTLSYILRKQYRNSDIVYEDLTRFVNQSGDLSSCELANHIATSSDSIYNYYYEDVIRYIISPVMRRFSLFSPIMCYLIFVDLICVMIDTCIEKGWVHKSKYLMQGVIGSSDMEYVWLNQGMKTWLTCMEVTMMRDELAVFSKLKDQHYQKQKKHAQ